MKKSTLVAIILLSSIVSLSAIPYIDLPARVFGVMAVEPKAETAAPQSVYLSQDFNISASVPDYVSATPSAIQFDAISSSGAGTVVSINAGELQFARTGNAGSFTRSTDFSPTPNTLRISFDLTVTGNSAQTTAAVFTVGSGFDTNNSAPANANVHSRVGLNFSGTNGSFSLRNITGSTNSAEFAGKQRVTWFISNLPGAIGINTPAGTLGNIGGDSALVYVGATQVLSIPALTATQTLTDFKFAITQGTGTVRIDNIVVEDIPSLANLPDWSNLQWPPNFSGTGGQQSETILGQIWEPGLTDAPGQGAGVTAQVGYGPLGSDPRANPNWIFASATFNTDVGNNDEYQGTFTLPNPPSTTQYSYTYRYSLDGGANWLYTDLDGNGEIGGLSFDPAQLGIMTVTHAPAPVISVSGGPLNFGNQAVNTTSASQSITISNNGEANLVLESPGFQSFPPEFAFVDDPKNVVIAPAESKNFAVTFTPTSAGVKTETVTINSNDMTTSRPTVVLTGTGVTPGQLSWTSPQYGANEGDGTVTLTVQRTGGTEGAVTVEYALTSDSATGGADCSFAGVDFVKTFGTISFANGETSKQISATICNDSVLEGNEGFVATLSAPTGGATLISPSVALVFIEDNEPRTFVVDVISDDAGYEFCEPNTPADCSLRGALGSVRDGDSITFDPALFNSASLAPAAMQTITLGSELVLNANMTITGPGASLLTIDGGPGANRIFNIAAGKSVTMSKMTLTGGNISGFGNHGGAILVNDGSTLDLASMTITGNTAYRGAGIYSRNSTVTIANSTISGNIATNVGGGISTFAETYNSHGSVSITNSVISGNRAYEGGGISAEGPTTITNSTISGNFAQENGGGIWADQAFSPGAVWLRVAGTTFSGNSAAISGGGVYLSTGNPTLLPEKPVSALTNSTFTANSAGSGYGSALRVSSQFAAVEVSSSTFAANPASSVSPSTIYSTALDSFIVVLRNTIVSGTGCSGPINNDGFNIDSGTSCGFGTANNSMSNTDPLLGPLQDNGGPTWTMAILPNSPAIDAGSAFGLSIDQRGLTRPIDHASVPNAGDGSDIGAFEMQAVSAASASISGRVLTTHGRGVSGVVITIQGTDGVSKTVVTNTLGYYKFNDLQTGELFVVTAKSKRYTFDVPVQVINLGDNIAGLDFRALL